MFVCTAGHVREKNSYACRQHLGGNKSCGRALYYQKDLQRVYKQVVEAGPDGLDGFYLGSRLRNYAKVLVRVEVLRSTPNKNGTFQTYFVADNPPQLSFFQGEGS